MDYKYIEQLLERYWLCETSLEEEQILRTFFSQENVPVSLLPYKDLFTYEQTDVEETQLGDDFDRRMLDMVGEAAPVKARTISLAQRLKPLFKAAAIVAIILTLGNAMQVAMQPAEAPDIAGTNGYNEVTQEGVSVAIADTMRQDSMKITEVPIIK
ncbi:MAG: pyruvate ferredoxin oxidoreductase [Prevotella sp.]|nr:pyruvate ferredoxin oxidoreductase [Prevotella sp.]